MRFAPLVLLLTAAPALAEPPAPHVSPRLADFEAGTFCAPEVMARIPAPETSMGSIGRPQGETRILWPTRIVPAALDVAFGIKARAAEGAIDDVTFSITHPARKDTGATRDAWQTWFSPLAPTADFWVFELPAELVPGRWIMRAEAGGELLFEVPFDVVPRAETAEIAEVCAGFAATLS